MDSKDSASAFLFPFFQSTKRRLLPCYDLFFQGNLEREIFAKNAQRFLFESNDEDFSLIACHEKTISCPLSGCKEKFPSFAEFERHYAKSHTGSCSVCRKQYPTTRLLHIHFAETHDSFFKAKAAKGIPMYECLVECCSEKFKSDFSRYQHLLDKHKFPKTFNFSKKSHASKKSRQKQRSQQKELAPGINDSEKISKQSPSELASIEKLRAQGSNRYTLQEKGTIDGDSRAGMDPNDELNTIMTGFSRLSTVCHSEENMPNVISFGRRRNVGAFQRAKAKKDLVVER